MIAHFESCVKCMRLIALITDGKFGARRRVCANVEKFVSWDHLKISLQTGCDNHASSTEMHCKSCRNHRIVLEKEQSGVDFSLQVAVQGVKKISTDHGPCLLYRVSQQCYRSGQKSGSIASPV